MNMILLQLFSLLNFIIFSVYSFPRDQFIGCDFNLNVQCNGDYPYRSADGGCNNLHVPYWGAANVPFKRYVEADYDRHNRLDAFRETSSDGWFLPSPRLISRRFHSIGRDVADNRYTTMLMNFGQFLDHDITTTLMSRDENGGSIDCRCSRFTHPECYPLFIDDDDKLKGKQDCFNFVRSATARLGEQCPRQMREQVNGITSFIDGSQIYGSTLPIQISLRTMKDGKLKASDNQMLPHDDTMGCIDKSKPKNVHCFAAGDNRVNTQPLLVSLHTLFLREHNRIAGLLQGMNPKWSDETTFQETRRIIIAQLQHITYNNFLPLILGKDIMSSYGLYSDEENYFYDEDVNPSIANAFSTAAFRFGHSMIPSNLGKADAFYRLIPHSIKRLRNYYFRVADVRQDTDMDSCVRDSMNLPSMQVDPKITEEMTDHLFEFSPGAVSFDIAALNIARGRDHGLPSYVVYRHYCETKGTILSPKVEVNWADLSRYIPSIRIERLRTLYHSPRDIDLFTGGLAESKLPGANVGPTFACIIGKQFADLKYGDRFFYLTSDDPIKFQSGQLRTIKQTTSLANLMCRNMKSMLFMQLNPFLQADPKHNKRINCEQFNDIDFSYWKAA
ncbi:hypothetical protein SNEBB_008749 [Seison nebaliae]|nr:hypothetical protein SNEBB_008749 [Seison nebaliae]